MGPFRDIRMKALVLLEISVFLEMARDLPTSFPLRNASVDLNSKIFESVKFCDQGVIL